MNNLIPTNLFGGLLRQGNIFVTRYFKGYAPQFLNNGTLPQLSLPPDFNSYTFSKASIPIDNKELFIPDVDRILTEYCNECLQVFFTIEFIELVNQQNFSSGFSLIDEKLEYAINLYLKICKLPMTTNDTEIRRTLSFYLGNQFGLNELLNSVWLNNLSNLKKLTEPTAKKYFDKLAQVNLPNQKSPSKLGDEYAKWFINKANSEMETDLNYYFETAKIRARLFNATDIINDPRFKASLSDSRWSEYDETIKNDVANYNRKFSATNGFVALDWRIVKAMVWTEILAGPKGNSAQWQKFPLQIGRFSADLGYSTVKSGGENSDLITSNEFRQEISSDVTGKNNIRAGIAYLYTIAVRNKITWSEIIDDSRIESYTVQKTDRTGLTGIANKLGTTTENIIKNSGLVNPAKLDVGQILKYQKAHKERRINGWNDWVETVKNYNGGGDPGYLEKFNRAYQIIINRTSK
jgi:LysM domain